MHWTAIGWKYFSYFGDRSTALGSRATNDPRPTKNPRAVMRATERYIRQPIKGKETHVRKTRTAARVLQSFRENVVDFHFASLSPIIERNPSASLPVYNV